jgi:ABC-type antimicrobial peptide transport system permease subunit
MALGADRSLVLRMILREGISKLTGGVVLGVIATYIAGRALQPLLYQVSPRDPLVIVGVVIGLLATGVVAALLPARRAMRFDPADALRQE